MSLLGLAPDSARKAQPPEACQMLHAGDDEPAELRSAQTAPRRALCMDQRRLASRTLRVANKSFQQQTTAGRWLDETWY